MKRNIPVWRVIVMTATGYAFGIVGLVAARPWLEGDMAVFLVSAGAFVLGLLLANLLLPGDRIPLVALRSGRDVDRWAALNAVVLFVALWAAGWLAMELGPGYSDEVLLFVFGPFVFIECLLARLAALRRGSDARES